MDRVKFYYFPASYYSQKACIAVEEVGLKHETIIIDIHAPNKPQKDPWYLRINPSGTVPTLQDGDVTVTDSEDIVTHVGKGTQLVPDVSTEYGKQVGRWRKIINDVSIELITMGTVFHPELSSSGFKAPMMLKVNKEKVAASFQEQLDQCRQLLVKHPDLKSEYTAKISKLEERLRVYKDPRNITPALDSLEKVFDQLEEQLSKMAADDPQNQWLCGPNFTAADINMCILLGRLDLLGHGERYHSDTKRPRVHAYWSRAKKRPSVKRITVNMPMRMMRMKMKEAVHKALPVLGGLVVLGVAVGAAGYFAHKRYT